MFNGVVDGCGEVMLDGGGTLGKRPAVGSDSGEGRGGGDCEAHDSGLGRLPQGAVLARGAIADSTAKCWKHAALGPHVSNTNGWRRHMRLLGLTAAPITQLIIIIILNFKFDIIKGDKIFLTLKF